MQQPVSQSYQAYYWNPEDGQSEVDFVKQKENFIVPLAVKSSTNLKSRSLRVYFDNYHPHYCIRTSLSGYQKQEWMQNIPLYGFQHWVNQSIV